MGGSVCVCVCVRVCVLLFFSLEFCNGTLKYYNMKRAKNEK